MTEYVHSLKPKSAGTTHQRTDTCRNGAAHRETEGHSHARKQPQRPHGTLLEGVDSTSPTTRSSEPLLITRDYSTLNKESLNLSAVREDCHEMACLPKCSKATGPLTLRGSVYIWGLAASTSYVSTQDGFHSLSNTVLRTKNTQAFCF